MVGLSIPYKHQRAYLFGNDMSQTTLGHGSLPSATGDAIRVWELVATCAEALIPSSLLRTLAKRAATTEVETAES